MTIGLLALLSKMQCIRIMCEILFYVDVVILCLLYTRVDAGNGPVNYLDPQVAMLLPSQVTLSAAGFVDFNITIVNESSILYKFRLRWIEPYKWNDEDKDAIYNLQKKRRYEIKCGLETENGKILRELINTTIFYKYPFQDYSERHEVAEERSVQDLYVQCGIRAKNGWDSGTIWSYSNLLRLKETPIYFRGLEGLNLRNFSKQDLVDLRAKIAIFMSNHPG